MLNHEEVSPSLFTPDARPQVFTCKIRGGKVGGVFATLLTSFP